MARSLIQTVNPSSQTVAVNSIISLGTVARRYGCNLIMSGNGIEVSGEGYYKVDSAITLTPTATGNVSVAMLVDGVAVPGAVATGSVSTVGNSVTLPIVATLRRACGCCDSVNNITFVLTSNASTVDNISVRIEKS